MQATAANQGIGDGWLTPGRVEGRRHAVEHLCGLRILARDMQLTELPSVLPDRYITGKCPAACRPHAPRISPNLPKNRAHCCIRAYLEKPLPAPPRCLARPTRTRQDILRIGVSSFPSSRPCQCTIVVCAAFKHIPLLHCPLSFSCASLRIGSNCQNVRVHRTGYPTLPNTVLLVCVA